MYFSPLECGSRSRETHIQGDKNSISYFGDAMVNSCSNPTYRDLSIRLSPDEASSNNARHPHPDFGATITLQCLFREASFGFTVPLLRHTTF